ncbi:MAG: hypothetical protein V4812_17750 [Pseudomonadota bacterium]
MSHMARYARNGALAGIGLYLVMALTLLALSAAPQDAVPDLGLRDTISRGVPPR